MLNVSILLFFLSARADAGKMNRIRRSDWFRERAQFSDLVPGQRNELDVLFTVDKFITS